MTIQETTLGKFTLHFSDTPGVWENKGFPNGVINFTNVTNNSFEPYLFALTDEHGFSKVADIDWQFVKMRIIPEIMNRVTDGNLKYNGPRVEASDDLVYLFNDRYFKLMTPCFIRDASDFSFSGDIGEVKLLVSFGRGWGAVVEDTGEVQSDSIRYHPVKFFTNDQTEFIHSNNRYVARLVILEGYSPDEADYPYHWASDIRSFVKEKVLNTDNLTGEDS